MGKSNWLALLLSISLSTTSQIAIAQTTVEQLFEQGISAQNAKKYIQSEEIWRQVLQINPTNAKAYYELGNALYFQKKLDQAVAAYQKAIQIDPNSLAAYYYLGLTLRDQKKPDLAITNFQKAIQLDSNLAVAYIGLGNCLRDENKLDEAIINFQKAVQIDPNNALAYYNLGLALRDQKKPNPAIANFQQAIQIDPNNALAYIGLGNALYDQKKLDQAITNYQKAIQLDPNNALAYIGLGDALYEQRKLDQAITNYQKAIQLDPNNALAYIGLGSTLYKQKKLDLAIANYQKAIQLDSNNALAYYNLGNVLYEQKKLDQAISNYQKALTLSEHTNVTSTAFQATSHNNLGWALQQQGKLKQAIEEFKKSLEIDPNFTLAQNNLKEAQRLLALKQNPQPPVADDRQWVPSAKIEPLVRVLRSVVRIAVTSSNNIGIGSGWVVKRKGDTVWIVTNRHVVTNTQFTGRTPDKINVEFYSEPPPGKFPPRHLAKILQITDSNDPLDLALLEVTGIPADIQPLPMYSSRVGRDTAVIVIGHPSNGATWSVVPGTISNFYEKTDMLKILATLAEGNSGGPVIAEINQKKQVVGLIVQIIPLDKIRVTAGYGLAYDMDVVIKKLHNWGIIP